MIPVKLQTTTELSRLKCRALIHEARFWRKAGDEKMVANAIELIKNERVNRLWFIGGNCPF